MIRDSILILIDSGVIWGTSLPAGFRGHTMAPAHVARASTNTDSIKGLAQSLAKPAYRRLLVAEPALRRAVPLLIITFLFTMAVGTGVQIFDHHREASVGAVDGIELFGLRIHLHLVHHSPSMGLHC